MKATRARTLQLPDEGRIVVPSRSGKLAIIGLPLARDFLDGFRAAPVSNESSLTGDPVPELETFWLAETYATLPRADVNLRRWRQPCARAHGEAWTNALARSEPCSPNTRIASPQQYLARP